MCIACFLPTFCIIAYFRFVACQLRFSLTARNPTKTDHKQAIWLVHICLVRNATFIAARLSASMASFVGRLPYTDVNQRSVFHRVMSQLHIGNYISLSSLQHSLSLSLLHSSLWLISQTCRAAQMPRSSKLGFSHHSIPLIH